MAKRIQAARLVLADGRDLSHYVTEITIPLNGSGLTNITAKFVGAQIDVDPETRQITVTIPDA